MGKDLNKLSALGENSHTLNFRHVAHVFIRRNPPKGRKSQVGIWSSQREKDSVQTPQQIQGVITKNRTFVTLPFVDGLSQELQRIYRTYGIATSFKPYSTLRKQLVSPKDPTPADKKSGVVYEIHCTNCSDIYIGHTGHQLGERLKEHKSLAPSRKLSAVAEHLSTTGHIIDWENTKVLDREDREYPRQVREAIYIKKKKPSLNRDQGLGVTVLI